MGKSHLIAFAHVSSFPKIYWEKFLTYFLPYFYVDPCCLVWEILNFGEVDSVRVEEKF